MSNCACRIVLENQWPTVAIDGSTGITGDVGNTMSALRSRTITTGQTSEINYTLPVTGYGDTLYINQSSTTFTYRLRLYSGASQAGDIVYDSGVIAMSDYIPAGVWRAGIDQWEARQVVGHAYQDAPVGYRSGKISMTGATVIKNITLGLGWQPVYGIEMGMGLEHIINTDIKETRGGSLIDVGNGVQRRSLDFKLPFLSDSERALFESGLIAGAGRWVLVDAIPKHATLRQSHIIVGRLAVNPVIYGSQHSISAKITEF